MTPAERARSDPHFARLVTMFAHEFENCDQAGAGLTPSEIREASAYAWQLYIERHPHPLHPLLRMP
jgi:hypothetical protein